MPFDSIKMKLTEDIIATQKLLIKKGIITEDEIEAEKKQK